MRPTVLALTEQRHPKARRPSPGGRLRCAPQRLMMQLRGAVLHGTRFRRLRDVNTAAVGGAAAAGQRFREHRRGVVAVGRSRRTAREQRVLWGEV